MVVSGLANSYNQLWERCRPGVGWRTLIRMQGPRYNPRHRTGRQGRQSVSAGKYTCHQAWRLWFDSWVPHGRTRKPISPYYPGCQTYTMACIHTHKIKINVIFLREGWDGKMVQWLIVLSVPPEDQVSSLAPTRWLPITWNYSTRGSYTILFSVGTKDAYSAQKYMGLFVCLLACLKALTALAQAPVSVLSTRIKYATNRL